MKIVDVHTHVFPPEIIKRRQEICKKDKGFSVLYGKESAVMVDIEGLCQYMESQGISYAAVLSFPFRDKGLLSLCNEYVVSALNSGSFLSFIMIDIYDEKWSERELERCFSKGARGVGEVSFYDGKFGKREFERLHGIASFLRERDGILLIHVNEQVGHIYNGKIIVDFKSLYQFVEKNPELKIILAHLGGGVCFYEFMPEVKKTFENVYYDTAAIPYIYVPQVYSFIETYLLRKVLFGSDFPLLSYSKYKEPLSMISPEGRELILYKNAERFFKMKWK